MGIKEKGIFEKVSGMLQLHCKFCKCIQKATEQSKDCRTV